jgi:hypothetical protein
MIIGSYSSLLEAVGFYLDNPKLTPHVNGFVQNWEERVLPRSEELRPLDGDVTQQHDRERVVAVPSDDYLGLKYAYVVVRTVRAARSRVAQPAVRHLSSRRLTPGCRSGSLARVTNFVFGPEPDDAYQIHLHLLGQARSRCAWPRRPTTTG